MNQFLFVANFKMNPISKEEIGQYLQVLHRESAGKVWNAVRGVLCPSFLHMSFFQELPAPFALGAQHGFPEKNGAFTGEVSFAMLKNIGAEYVIIGHSERRQFFGETDETVHIRTESALKFLLQPIVCIGETESELKKGERNNIIIAQIEAALTNLSKMQAEKIIFAYEPRYAIGTDTMPASEDIALVGRLIRSVLVKNLGEVSAARVRVLYGGSVKASNIGEVAFVTGMDGVLVGKAALSPYETVKMMELANKYQENKNEIKIQS